MQNKLQRYLSNIENLKIDFASLKPINNILLTGATGFLGCNILNQLLQSTNYKIFLLVRATSQQEAINRINKKFQFYFDCVLNDVLNIKLFVINADYNATNILDSLTR